MLFALAALAFSSPISAQPNAEIGTDSISPGETATINLFFEADGNVSGLDFKFAFDNTEFPVVTPSCVTDLPTTGSGQATVSCSVSGNLVSVFISPEFGFPVSPIVSGKQSLGSITFQSQPTTPFASYGLPVQVEHYFNSVSAAVLSTPSTDGSIQVVDGVVYCNNVVISQASDVGLLNYEACEQLTIGPAYVAEPESDVILSSGVTIELVPEVRFDQGATIDMRVCGQSLCEASDTPMPLGCNSCVDQICAADPACCDPDGGAYSQACVDKVSSVCGLTCQ